MVEYDSNLSAKVVRLYNGPIRVPHLMGVPREDQMKGTDSERLCELAGRVCYDSMGTKSSRNSPDYHKHIGQVRHFSTIEHAVFTVEIDMSKAQDSQTREWVLDCLLNRPQMTFNRVPFQNKIRVTLNLRHVIEWDKHSDLSDTIQASKELRGHGSNVLGEEIWNAIQPYAPMIIPERPKGAIIDNLRVSVVEPVTDNEKQIAVFMAGGRGFSHEQVRHRFAISQRSSRFCDESESPIITHPLLSEFYADNTIAKSHRDQLKDTRAGVHKVARELYAAGVTTLESWLITRGVDKLSARKQARGTMRNDLGNGLYTELIFTASVNMWKHMFTMRACSAADAEIREVFCRLLPTLQEEGVFVGWKMTPAPDGLGHCVVM